MAAILIFAVSVVLFVLLGVSIAGDWDVSWSRIFTISGIVCIIIAILVGATGPRK